METREAYRQKIESQLKEWGEAIDELKKKAEKAAGALKAEHEDDIRKLTAKKDELHGQLKEFMAASDEAWKIMRKALEKAAEDLKKAFGKARKKYK